MTPRPPRSTLTDTLFPDTTLFRSDDWFFVANAVSDTVFEPRTFPIPVGVQTTERPGSLDVFGKDRSFVFAQTFIAGAALIKGSTAFKPPDIEYRVTLARSEEHTSELQSLMRNSYAVFCLKKKTK